MKLQFTSSPAFSLALLVACGSADPATNRNPEIRATNTQQGAQLGEENDGIGGVTGDFGGNFVSCRAEKFESPGDAPTVGISVDEVISLGTGTLALPFRWLSACEDPNDAQRPSECQGENSIAHTLANTETTLHIEIVPGGEPARVLHTTEEQPVCGQSLRLPVNMRVVTDDGVLDEQVALDLITECGGNLGFSIYNSPSVFGGRLARASEQWPAEAKVELSGGFYLDRVWFDIYVLPADSPSWLLTGKIVRLGEPVHDVSRSEAGLTDGASLGEKRCQFGG